MSRYREEERKAILDCFRNYSGYCSLEEEEWKEIAREIELGIYNSTIDAAVNEGIPTYWDNSSFLEEYAARGYRVKMNLDPDSSVNKNQVPEVREFLLQALLRALRLRKLGFEKKEIQSVRSFTPCFLPAELGELGSELLNPHINQAYREQIHLREQQTTNIKYSTMYTCACGERKTLVYEQQTRSGDEGGTIIANCIGCGRRWSVRT